MTRTLGAWDCKYCNTKTILGNVFDCPGCGHPRPRGVHFYQILNAPLVTPEIAKQLGSGGPNWYCEHCDSGNKDSSDKCWNCGAERGSSPSHEVKNYRQGEAVPRSTKEAEASDPDGKSWVDVLPVNQPKEPDQTSYLSSDTEEPFLTDSGSKIKPFAIGASVIAGLVIISFLVYMFFFKTREEMVQVSGFSWTQSVSIQEYQVVHDSSWTTHPSDAYNIYSDYRDTGRDEKITDGWTTEEYQDTCYETVYFQDTCTGSRYVSETCTGTRDNGDGSYETYDYECGGSESYEYSCTNTRQEPYSCTKTHQVELYHYEDVYDWYYEFDINRWMTVANYPTSGSDHEPYYFSGFVLSNPYDGQSAPQLGQQQQSQIPGVYSVSFSCDNHKVGNEGYFTREYPQPDWTRFEPGVDYPIKVNAFNLILTYPVP